MAYEPSAKRYESKNWFRRCGTSGLMLPAISLGCWHNFGGVGTDSASPLRRVELPRELPTDAVHRI